MAGDVKPLAEMGRFKTVVIDPPWDIGLINYSANGYDQSLDYPTMSIEQLADISISSVADDESWLFCWSTNKTLADAQRLIDRWGFAYCFVMAWVKNAGPQAPNTPCFNTEFIVVGRKGHPEWLDTKAFRTGNFWPRGAHSEKPEGFYDLLRRVTPGPRLDIFGRRRIAGFHSWGNEAPEGEPAPDHYQTVMP